MPDTVKYAVLTCVLLVSLSAVSSGSTTDDFSSETLGWGLAADGTTYVDTGLRLPPGIAGLEPTIVAKAGHTSVRLIGQRGEAMYDIGSEHVTLRMEGNPRWTLLLGQDLAVLVDGRGDLTWSFPEAPPLDGHTTDGRIRIPAPGKKNTYYRVRPFGLDLEHVLGGPPIAEDPEKLASLGADAADFVLAETVTLAPGQILLTGGREILPGQTVEWAGVVDIVDRTRGMPAGVHFGRPVVRGIDDMPVLSPVRYRIEHLGATRYRFETRLPMSWLLDPSRDYPLIIDPNTVIYTLASGALTWETVPVGASFNYSREQWVLGVAELQGLPPGSIVFGVSLLAGLNGAESRTSTSVSLANPSQNGYGSPPAWLPAGTQVFSGDWGRMTASGGWWGELDDPDGVARQNLSTSGSADFLYTGGDLALTVGSLDGDTVGLPQIYGHVPCVASTWCAAAEEDDVSPDFGADADRRLDTRPAVRLWVNAAAGLTIGEAHDDSIPPGSWQLNMYVFTLADDAPDVDIVTSSNGGVNGDVDLWLYNSNGVVLAVDTGPGFSSLLDQALPAGSYFLKVAEEGRDALVDYEILVSTNPPGAPTGVAAFTTKYGASILESTWQKDDDPFFTWSVPNSPDVIVGYTISYEGTPLSGPLDTATNEFQFSPSAIPNGVWDVRVRAISQAGYAGQVSSPFTISVDDLAETPQDLVCSPTGGGPPIAPASWQVAKEVTLGWSDAAVHAPTTGYRLGIDTAPICADNVDTISTAWDVPMLSDGVHTLYVMTVDVATNCSSASSFTIWVDGTAEEIDTISMRPASGGVPISTGVWQSDRDPFFNWTLVDAGVSPTLGYSYQVGADPDTAVDIDVPQIQLPPGFLANGVHDFRVRAVDVASNPGPVAVLADIRVDDHAEPPTGLLLTDDTDVIVVQEHAWTNLSPVRLHWTDASVHAPAADYSTADSSVPDCKSGLTGSATAVDFPSLGEGPHTLQVTTVDEADNCSAAASFTVNVDYSREQLTDLAALDDAHEPIPSRSWTADNDPLFTWSEPASLSPVMGYSVGFNEPPDCIAETSNPEFQTASGLLPDGRHTFYANSIDEAGNCGETANFDLWVNAHNTQVDLGISLDDGVDAVVAEAPLTYSMTAANLGPSPALAVVIESAMSPDLTGCSWTCSPSGSAVCGNDAGVGEISEQLDLPDGGAAAFTVDCTVSSDASGPIDFSATITEPAWMADFEPANNSVTDRNHVPLFADGFESGNTLAWAAAVGTTEPLAWTAVDLESEFRASLTIDPSRTRPFPASAIPVVTGFAGPNTPIWVLELRSTRNRLELRALARLDDGSWAGSRWRRLPNSLQDIEIQWRRAGGTSSDGMLTVFVGAGLDHLLSDLDNGDAPLMSVGVLASGEGGVIGAFEPLSH